MKRALLVATLLSTGLLLGCPPRTPQDRLRGALRQGKTQAVQQALEQGADLSQPFDGEQTALHLLADSMRPEASLVPEIVSKGVSVVAKDARGRTAWDVAWEARGGVVDAERAGFLLALLEAGYPLPPKQPDGEGLTFLHRAAQRCRSAELLRALVKTHGFAVDARDANGWTPLHHAAYEGNYQAAEGLLEVGADANAETTREVGQTALRGGETQVTIYRLEAGSRPWDLYHRAFTRGTPDFGALMKQHGGSKNEKVKNQFR